ncbi:MAG: sigma-70 family RNA polymerase sigma factor [Acidimicrobiia bacterium]|nr:sigma-70 family RNA polymerase sigma factor [Acidimicrobiia bacterium]
MTNEVFDSILDAARTGADWAWRKFYEDLAPRLNSYLRLRGAEDPEGLVGEVFLEAARAISSFEGDERGFRSWLFTMAHSRLIDERRRRTRRKTAPADLSDLAHVADDQDVEGEVLRHLASERLTQLFSVLTPDQRDVLTLRIIADLSVAETAAVLGKSAGSVKVLQHRGLRRLKQLEQKGVTK